MASCDEWSIKWNTKIGTKILNSILQLTRCKINNYVISIKKHVSQWQSPILPWRRNCVWIPPPQLNVRQKKSTNAYIYGLNQVTSRLYIYIYMLPNKFCFENNIILKITPLDYIFCIFLTHVPKFVSRWYYFIFNL